MWKKIWVWQNFLSVKDLGSIKNFRSEQILNLKKIWGLEKVWVQEIVLSKNIFCVKKKICPKYLWVQKIFWSEQNECAMKLILHDLGPLTLVRCSNEWIFEYIRILPSSAKPKLQLYWLAEIALWSLLDWTEPTQPEPNRP